MGTQYGLTWEGLAGGGFAQSAQQQNYVLGGLQWTGLTPNIQGNFTGSTFFTSNASTIPSPALPQSEDEIAWLKRRVREVLWQP